MNEYRLVLQRKVGKRTGDDKIQRQVEYLTERGLAGNRGKNWTVETTVQRPIQQDGLWVFTCECIFHKVKGQLGGDAEYKQWEAIKAMIIQSGQNTKFGEYPWTVRAESESSDTESNEPTPENPETLADVISDVSKQVITKLEGVRLVTNSISIFKTWKDLEIPPELLGRNSDRELANHPAWKHLYGLGPQIRILLSNIQRAKETEGRVRNHAVLFGHSGCGKSTCLLALEEMFGQGAVLRLDATSTTRPGIEKLFFNDLPFIPPLVFMEEAEKANVDALLVWLGALDDRGEIRKVNFRVNQLREVQVIFNCTVNDKKAFDRMMGSDGTEAGALSSRCVTQVYFPRPTDSILRQILQKEINQFGGNDDWITPALELAKELNITDPRIVRSFLAGGDRLLNGTYQNDWRLVNQAKQSFQK
jgi:hypothetical protein